MKPVDVMTVQHSPSDFSWRSSRSIRPIIGAVAWAAIALSVHTPSHAQSATTDSPAPSGPATKAEPTQAVAAPAPSGSATALYGQAPAPDKPSPRDAAPAPAAPAPTTTTTDHEAVFRAFSQYAAYRRQHRLIEGAAGILTGGAILGLGAGLASEGNTAVEPWVIGGGVVMGLSTLMLLARTEPEEMAEKFNVQRTDHSKEQAVALERAWERLAIKAAASRRAEAVAGFVLGVGAIVAGAVVLSGTGDLSHSDRLAVGGILAGVGTSMGIGSISLLFRRRSEELSYEQFKATTSTERTWTVGLGGGPNSVGLLASGRF